MTNSIAWPNMFDVSRNRVSVLEGNASIVNRGKLLILSEHTSLYNNPNFGVGLKRHLWQYNRDNEKAVIRDRITDQLRLHEPSCDADKTQYADGLLFSGEDEASMHEQNKLKMTVGLKTIYGDTVEVKIENE